MDLSPQKICSAVKKSGVIGAGGGGFPAHVKLSAKVETVIANGSECEPLLASDKTLLKERPDLVIDGLGLAMTAVGAKKGIVAVKGYYKDVVAAVKDAIPKEGGISIHLLENYYPAGDEFMLVYDVTGKVIPEGGIPLNAGVVVSNVMTLAQIAHAVSGKPVTERMVTICGEVNDPKVVTAPIGTKYRDLIGSAGGLKSQDAAIIDGGPMMGKIVEDMEQGIGKTTSGIVALPRDHFIVQQAQKPLSQVIKQSKSACCQCFRCSDMCPRNLLGHDLYPHMTMRTIDYNQDSPARHITSAFLCSQCGMCELVACDIMRLSPRKIFAAYKKELTARGIKNPHARSRISAKGGYDYVKVSIPMVMKKLDLGRYAGSLPYAGAVEPSTVRLPLSRHTGAPAVPAVKLRERVKMCDVVASSPPDKLGTVCHASIAGEVTEVTDEWVEITR